MVGNWVQQERLFLGPVSTITIGVTRVGVERYDCRVSHRREMDETGCFTTEEYHELDSGELLDVLGAVCWHLLELQGP